jgi:hypothetical protein
MPSPFPGMDPYLEHPSRWPEVHSRLIAAIANSLESRLSEAYFIGVEKRVYQLTTDDSILIGIPDTTIAKHSTTAPDNQSLTTTATLAATENYLTVTLPIPIEIKESYLEIRDIETSEVITAIEVLSPINKRTGEGRRTYEFKRQSILGSQTHLVEIDLLRSGSPMPMLGTVDPTDYRLLVSRASRRPQAQLYGFNIEQTIPEISIPLKSTEPDLHLDIQTLLAEIYTQARYNRRIDYQKPPVPPFKKTIQPWASDRIATASL